MIIRAEWPGYVVDVLVHADQEVEEDEALLLLEGTDQDHTQFYVMAPDSGKVRKVLVEEGDFAEEDDELVDFADMD